VILEPSVVKLRTTVMLEFHPSWSLLGHSLGLSMFATLSMAYRVLLVVPSYLPNLALGFTT
jgi:hypothetical protein